MAIGGYASSSWQFSRLNNANGRASVFDTVNSNASAKLGTTDEEETIDVSSLSASERRLIEAKEMEDFKAEIYAEVKDIIDNRNSNILSSSVHITDDAFQKMKDDPEFKDKVLNNLVELVQCKPTYLFEACTTITVTDDDNPENWDTFIYMIHPDDDEETKNYKQQLVTESAQGSFYSVGFEDEPSDGLDFDEIWFEQKEQLEYQETIRKQHELISKGGEN